MKPHSPHHNQRYTLKYYIKPHETPLASYEDITFSPYIVCISFLNPDMRTFEY